MCSPGGPVQSPVSLLWACHSTGPSWLSSLLSTSSDVLSQSSRRMLRPSPAWPGPARNHPRRRQLPPLGPPTALGGFTMSGGAEEKEGNSPFLVPPGLWGHQARPRRHCHLILTAMEVHGLGNLNSERQGTGPKATQPGGGGGGSCHQATRPLPLVLAGACACLPHRPMGLVQAEGASSVCRSPVLSAGQDAQGCPLWK